MDGYGERSIECGICFVKSATLNRRAKLHGNWPAIVYRSKVASKANRSAA
jgi:hypothetical protein